MFYGRYTTFYWCHMTFYGRHTSFYGRHTAFYGCHSMCYGRHAASLGSMVISRLTYQYLDLYYLQFADKNYFYFWLPYHTVKIGNTWNKGDTAYARRVHTTFIRAHTVLLPIDLLQYSLASSYVVFIPNILYNLLLMSFSISGVISSVFLLFNTYAL